MGKISSPKKRNIYKGGLKTPNGQIPSPQASGATQYSEVMLKV